MGSVMYPTGARHERRLKPVTDPIADLRSPGGSLISLYVERPAPGGFAALLTDLLKPIREIAEESARSTAMSVRNDAARIHDLAGRLETDAAPSFAVFASDADDVWVVEALAHRVNNIATIGPRPYLRPLRAAPRVLRSGVIVADRVKARTFIGFDGIVEEIGSALEVDSGKSNFGGFEGYEEAGVRARADEASARLWKEAGRRLLDAHQKAALDYLAVGGYGETIEEISRSLHPYLARLPRAVFVSNPNKASLDGLRSHVARQDEIIRRQRQESLAGRVCDTAWSGGSAVLGLAASLDAVNVQAVDTLVVAGEFSRSGMICNECGNLSRQDDDCRVCGAATFAVDDVVAGVMDATVASGGRVFQINVPSALDVEGIGALTRFPLPR